MHNSGGFLVTMEQWTGAQRAFFLERFFKANDSYVIARRQFCARYNIRRPADAPCLNLFKSWLKKFRETGSTVNERPRGRRRSITVPETVDDVRAAVRQHPRHSIRKQSQALEIPRTSLHRILQRDLHFHPYKIQIVQALKEEDYAIRHNFAEVMLNDFFDDNRINNILFSDEAHFHLNGAVNKQNCRYWAPENPREKHQRPLHSPKVTVWCAMSASGIIGPYFFENARGVTVTVTSDRYATMIREFFAPALQRFHGHNNETWFQQDGATSHTAAIAMQAVRGLFPGKLISKFGDINWPPRSPDLTPMDFFYGDTLNLKFMSPNRLLWMI